MSPIWGGNMKLKQSTMCIGQNLKMIRLQAGYSQTQLVTKLQLAGINISLDIYKKIEQNKYNIDIEIIVAFHDLLNVSYDDIFYGLSICAKNF